MQVKPNPKCRDRFYLHYHDSPDEHGVAKQFVIRTEHYELVRYYVKDQSLLKERLNSQFRQAGMIGCCYPFPEGRATESPRSSEEDSGHPRR